MITFIYGRAGSGKSTYIYDRIASDLKNGRKPLLLVPEQQALYAERQIADLTSDYSSIELEVLNFRRLANRVFREYGGLTFNNIDDGGKLLIMWRVLNEISPFLKEYDGLSEKDISFAELMLKTVQDMKMYNVSPHMLEVAVPKLKEEHPSLSRKLEDIALIYATYQSFLNKEYNDPTDELTRLADTLSENEFFNSYNVYIDSFDGFTPQQYRVIDAIFRQSANVTVSLCIDPEDTVGIFETTHKTLKSLKKISVGVSDGKGDIKEIYLSDDRRFENTELAYVSHNLWNRTAPPLTLKNGPQYVKTAACRDVYEECEFVASDIMRRVREGARYRDIVVIARDISLYEGLLDTELEKCGIPFFMSRRTDVTTKPVFKLILAALSIKNRNWRYSDVISYVKTGLAGLTYDECDLLENYVSAWNISGSRWYDEYDWNMNPDGYTDNMTDEGRETISKANEIRRRIVAPLSKFFESIGNTTVLEVTRALYDFLLETGVREKLEEQAQRCSRDGKDAEASELIQLWNILMASLDTIVDIAGDMKTDSDRYFTILKLLLSRTDIGTIPSKCDEVILGSALNLRSANVTDVYLLGVNDGVFPRAVSEEDIFSDAELNILKTADIKIYPDTKDRTGDELYYFYRAVSSSSRFLSLVYSETDLGGAALKMSLPARRVDFLLGGKTVTKYADIELSDKIYGYRAGLKYLSMYPESEEGKALQKIYNADDKLRQKLYAFRTPLEEREAYVGSSLLSELYKGDIVLSQSRLNRYIECPFSYHCQYMLRLKEKKTAVFRSADIGTFIHAVLERFMARVVTDDGVNTDIQKQEIERIVDEIINDYISTVCFDVAFSSARMRELFKRLRRTSLLLIDNILSEFRQSEFVPAFFEMPVKMNSENGVEPYKIPLSDGTNLYMQGIIDRVDTYKKGKDVYVRVVDYKTGTKTFSPDDIALGLNLQMLLYLFALWNSKSEKFKQSVKCEGSVLPAGILYFSAQAPDAELDASDDDEKVKQKAENDITRKGILISDLDVLKAMDKELQGRYIPVKLKADGSFTKYSYVGTLEKFGEIMQQVNDVVDKIACEMKGGNVSASPLDKTDPCRYCKMKPVCRKV